MFPEISPNDISVYIAMVGVLIYIHHIFIDLFQILSEPGYVLERTMTTKRIPSANWPHHFFDKHYGRLDNMFSSVGE